MQENFADHEIHIFTEDSLVNPYTCSYMNVSYIASHDCVIYKLLVFNVPHNAGVDIWVLMPHA